MSAKFNYKEHNGIYYGNAYAAVRLNTSQPGRILARIVEVTENSDFHPMVKSINRRVHNDQDFFIIQMFSESDSLSFLKARFDQAFEDFQERIEAALPVSVHSGESIEGCIDLLVSAPVDRRPAARI